MPTDVCEMKSGFRGAGGGGGAFGKRNNQSVISRLGGWGGASAWVVSLSAVCVSGGERTMHGAELCVRGGLHQDQDAGDVRLAFILPQHSLADLDSQFVVPN